MSNQYKIYCVDGEEYTNWMSDTNNIEIIDNIEEADIVTFPGGLDVDPITAGEPVRHPKVYSDINLDNYHLGFWEKAIKLKKKIVATCRSAQISCVISGGKLVRDMDNSLPVHNIITYDGLVLPCPSEHHNSMHPWNLDKDKWRLLGWTIGASEYHEDCYGNECINGMIKGNENDKECEIVLFRDINCLSLQDHCEWSPNNPKFQKTREYFKDLLDKFMDDKL